MDSHIQRRWMNSLLNSGQSKEHHTQLSPTIRQSSPSSSILNTLVSRKDLRSKLFFLKKCSDKRQNQHQQQYETKRRARCATFEEHLQRYYYPKWCFTYTRDFQHQKVKSCN
jgi:hypothetical protein